MSCVSQDMPFKYMLVVGQYLAFVKESHKMRSNYVFYDLADL